jgi:hypothetical protein
MTSTKPASQPDRVVALLARVRSVIASYEGGEPERHAFRLIHAVADDAKAETVAAAALASSVGADATRRFPTMSSHQIVVKAIDRAIDARTA